MPGARPADGGEESAPGGDGIVMVTEGTYPHGHGGVSVWCDQLLRGVPELPLRLVALTGFSHQPVEWQVPDNVADVTIVGLWDEQRRSRRRWRRRRPSGGRRRRRPQPAPLAAALAALLTAPHDEVAWFGRFVDTASDIDPAEVARQLSFGPLLEALDAELRREPPAGVRWEPLQAVRAADLVQVAHLLEHLLRPLAIDPGPAAIYHATCNGLAALVAMVAQRRHGARFVLTEHGIYLRERYLELRRLALARPAKALLLRFHRLVTGAAYVRATVVSPASRWNVRWAARNGTTEDRVRPIHNGVEPEMFPERDGEPDEPVVAWVGRIDPIKDLETLIAAFAVVRETRPDARLRLYGRTPPGGEDYKTLLDELVAELDLGDMVSFEGGVSHGAVAYRQAQVAVLSSISEGFPYAVIEAMASGIPAVSTGVGGVTEAIADTGVVVPPRSPEPLGRALVELLDDGPRRRELGAKARERIMTNFTLDHCLDRYRQLYAEVARTPDRRRPRSTPGAAAAGRSGGGSAARDVRSWAPVAVRLMRASLESRPGSADGGLRPERAKGPAGAVWPRRRLAVAVLDPDRPAPPAATSPTPPPPDPAVGVGADAARGAVGVVGGSSAGEAAGAYPVVRGAVEGAVTGAAGADVEGGDEPARSATSQPGAAEVLGETERGLLLAALGGASALVQAVDVDEVAATLESVGVTDPVAADCYGSPDVFHLAERLWQTRPSLLHAAPIPAQVAPAPPTSAAAPSTAAPDAESPPATDPALADRGSAGSVDVGLSQPGVVDGPVSAGSGRGVDGAPGAQPAGEPARADVTRPPVGRSPALDGALSRGLAYVLPAFVVAAAVVAGADQTLLVAASVAAWGLAQAGGVLAYTVLLRSAPDAGLAPLRRGIHVAAGLSLLVGLGLARWRSLGAGAAVVGALPLLHLVGATGLVVASRGRQLLGMVGPVALVAGFVVLVPDSPATSLVGPGSVVTVAAILAVVGNIARRGKRGVGAGRVLQGPDWRRAAGLAACGWCTAAFALTATAALGRTAGMGAVDARLWLVLGLPLWTMVGLGEWFVIRVRHVLVRQLDGAESLAGFRTMATRTMLRATLAAAVALAVAAGTATGSAVLTTDLAAEAGAVVALGFAAVAVALYGVTVLTAAGRVGPVLSVLGATVPLLWWTAAATLPAAAILAVAAARTLTNPATHR